MPPPLILLVITLLAQVLNAPFPQLQLSIFQTKQVQPRLVPPLQLLISLTQLLLQLVFFLPRFFVAQLPLLQV